MLHHYRCIRHIYPYLAGKHAGNITTQLYEQIQLGPTTFQLQSQFCDVLNFHVQKQTFSLICLSGENCQKDSLLEISETKGSLVLGILYPFMMTCMFCIFLSGFLQVYYIDMFMIDEDYSIWNYYTNIFSRSYVIKVLL